MGGTGTTGWKLTDTARSTNKGYSKVITLGVTTVITSNGEDNECVLEKITGYDAASARSNKNAVTELIKVSASVKMEYLKIIVNTTQTHSVYTHTAIRDYNHNRDVLSQESSLIVCQHTYLRV